MRLGWFLVDVIVAWLILLLIAFIFSVRIVFVWGPGLHFHSNSSRYAISDGSTARDGDGRTIHNRVVNNFRGRACGRSYSNTYINRHGGIHNVVQVRGRHCRVVIIKHKR